MLRAPTFRSLQTLTNVPRCSAQRSMSVTVTKQTGGEGKKMSLSERLGGGAGRGKPLAADDPFAAFLANAQKKTQSNNNGRPQQFNRNRRTNSKPGQFDDAVETAAPRSQQQQRTERGADGNRRREKKRSTFQRRQPEQRSPLPKASAFVSKDIDWSSFDTVSHPGIVSATADQVVTEDERVAQRLEIQGGDYERYLHVQGIQSSGQLNAEAIERLVGQNATYSLPEKTTFLATLSNAATGARPVASKK